jgi:hypothetical protein
LDTAKCKKAGFTLVELQEMFSPEARVKYDKLIRLLFIPLKETAVFAMKKW